MALVFLLWAAPLWAAPALVSQTGQEASFVAGDDGSIQAGVPLPTPRFTDNGDGAVTDRLTKLMWLKDLNCIKHKYPLFDQDRNSWDPAGDGLVTWFHALEFVAGINAGVFDCGVVPGRKGVYTDWRLPNIRELFSLIDFKFYPYALSDLTGTAMAADGNPFIGLEPGNWWSSTRDAGSNSAITAAWFITFYDFRMSDGNSSAIGGYVTAVRGPQ